MLYFSEEKEVKSSTKLNDKVLGIPKLTYQLFYCPTIKLGKNIIIAVVKTIIIDKGIQNIIYISEFTITNNNNLFRQYMLGLIKRISREISDP
jgi:hypothetical protein